MLFYIHKRIVFIYIIYTKNICIDDFLTALHIHTAGVMLVNNFFEILFILCTAAVSSVSVPVSPVVPSFGHHRHRTIHQTLLAECPS